MSGKSMRRVISDVREGRVPEPVKSIADEQAPLVLQLTERISKDVLLPFSESRVSGDANAIAVNALLSLAVDVAQVGIGMPPEDFVELSRFFAEDAWPAAQRRRAAIRNRGRG